MGMPIPKLLAAMGAGALAAVAAAVAASTPFALRPGERAWAALVRGTDDGTVRGRVVVFLPGLDRREGATLWIEAEGAAPALTVATDERPAEWVPLKAGVPMPVAIPPSRVPGARLALGPAAGDEAARIRVMRAESRGRPAARAAIWAFGLTIAFALALFAWRAPRAGALGLTAGGLIAAAFVPARLLAAIPSPGALARLAPTLALLAAGVILGLRQAERAQHRRFVADVALAAALVFGAAVRLWLLPSAGSWDTEYWKAWTHQAVSQGVAHVYGGTEAVPDGRFLAQLRGEEPSWQAPYRGRDFGVDYPPLAMVLWRASAGAVRFLGRSLDPSEAESIAVKLPALFGDIASVLFLLWALGRTPRRALALAALYWALPVSWLNSAAQGFMDAAYAPLLGAALVKAGRGRAVAAGAFLACAGLVKPTAIVVVPAVAVALWPVARGWVKAAAAGLAVAVVVLAPFALARTLDTLVVHVGRVFLQERLSGGYANAWWLVGEMARAAREGLGAWANPAPFQRLEFVALPARPLGGMLVLLAAAWIVLCLRQTRGPRAAALAGGTLVFAYGMLAIGVHENHPHPMFLLWCAAGLASTRLRIIAAGTATAYVLDILMLSGLGRFHGTRHLALEPLLPALAGLRLALGRDGMLLLAAVNVVLFVWLMASLKGELARVSE